jgi:hypothetical protein
MQEHVLPTIYTDDMQEHVPQTICRDDMPEHLQQTIYTDDRKEDLPQTNNKDDMQEQVPQTICTDDMQVFGLKRESIQENHTSVNHTLEDVYKPVLEEDVGQNKRSRLCREESESPNIDKLYQQRIMPNNYCTEENNRNECEQEKGPNNVAKELTENVSQNVNTETEDIYKETLKNVAINGHNRMNVEQEAKQQRTMRKFHSKSSPAKSSSETNYVGTAHNNLERRDLLGKEDNSSKTISIQEDTKAQSKRYRKSGDKSSVSESLDIKNEFETNCNAQQHNSQVSYSKEGNQNEIKAKEDLSNSVISSIPIVKEVITPNINKCDLITRKQGHLNDIEMVKPGDSVECGANIEEQKEKKNMVPKHVNRQEEKTKAKAVVVAKVSDFKKETQKEKKVTSKTDKQPHQEVKTKMKNKDSTDITMLKNKKIKLDNQGTLNKPINEKKPCFNQLKRPYKGDNECSPVKKVKSEMTSEKVDHSVSVKTTVVDGQPKSINGRLLLWWIDF